MSAPVVTDAQVKVQETADDAAMSKLSAVRMGYVNDPFISIFVPKFQRRSPLINRGYFARMSAVDLVIKRFVSVCNHNGGSSNVVSLGAGVDTAFFRACMNKYAPTHYYEVDFHDITTKKVELIEQHEVLQKYIAAEPVDLSELPTIERLNPYPASASPAKSQQEERTQTKAAAGAKENKYHGIQFLPVDAGGSDAKGMDLHGKRYSLVTADLRDIAALQAALHSAGFNPAVPTLFLSECVLVYLEPEDSCSIIAWAAKSCPKSVFVTYEQIRPHDAFGQIMARNLEERGYALRGLHAFPDIQAQVARYVELGYSACTVIDMNDVYYRLLPRAEVARVERLELFDELEEWHLMSAHYALALAVNDVDLGGEGGGRLADVLHAAASGQGPIRSTGMSHHPVGSPLPAGASSSSLRTPAGGSKADAYDSELASASGRSTPASSTVGTPASKMARTGSTPTPMTKSSAPFGTAQAEAGTQHAATGIEMSSPRDLANAVVHTHEEVERMHGHGAHGGSSMARGSLGSSARSGLGLSITAGGGSVSGAPPSPTHSVASMSSTHSALPAYTSAYGGALGVSMSLSSSLSGRASLGGGGAGIGSAARGRASVGGTAPGSSSMPPTAPGSISRGGERRDRSRSGSAAMDSETEGVHGPGAYASRDHGLVASATRAGLAGQSPRPMSVSGMSVSGTDSVVRGSSTPMSASGTGGGGTVGAGGALSMTGALDNTTHGAGHAPVPLGAGGTLFHTQAGDIVLGTAGPVDFNAIAAADDEMSHARHMREALGVDLLRDTGEDIEDTASVVSSMSTSHGIAGDSSAHGMVEALPRSRGESSAGQGSGGMMAPPPPPGVGVSGKSSSTSTGTGTGKRSKDAATAKSAAAAGAQHAHSKAEVAALLMAPVKEDTPSSHGKGVGNATGSLSLCTGGTHHLYKPAVDNSRQHSLHAVTGMTHRPPYDAAAIDASAASGRRVSLFDMLFPVDAWNTPASAGSTRQAQGLSNSTAVQRA